MGPPQIRDLLLPVLAPGSDLTERLTALARRAAAEGFLAIEHLLDDAIEQTARPAA